MCNGNAFVSKMLLQDDTVCDDAFSNLVQKIEALPAETRGAQALNLSAHLLEIAAFELAGSVESRQVGALIDCAAQLSEQSSEFAADKLHEIDHARRVFQ
ncbi:hypothetical protein [Roseobacter weihaiensis]|uniref:hypothetical protein n=1 Tax=Roseobacter weihaiensis TaxID=2763262 RepID=UPI001D09CDDB|nr:hypothetical protein [Roseobacter sp. H9]